jgi:hypothetical protein
VALEESQKEACAGYTYYLGVFKLRDNVVDICLDNAKEPIRKVHLHAYASFVRASCRGSAWTHKAHHTRAAEAPTQSNQRKSTEQIHLTLEL